jgi:hypothetical protein
MKKPISTLTLSCLTVILMVTLSSVYGQEKSIPDFLKEKQTWNEKLVVIYTPTGQEYAGKEQLNAFFSSINSFKKEKITVVQLPTSLSMSNRLYLKQKFRYHSDRLNVWVFDEKGNLRMSSTKVVLPEQVLRILTIETRPDALAKAQYFWND